MATVTRGWPPWVRDIVLTLGEGEGRPLSSGLGGTVSASPSAKESTESDNRRRLATTLEKSHQPLRPSSSASKKIPHLMDSSVSSERPRRLGDRRKRLLSAWLREV